jgi:hypothetical protein
MLRYLIINLQIFQIFGINHRIYSKWKFVLSNICEETVEKLFENCSMMLGQHCTFEGSWRAPKQQMVVNFRNMPARGTEYYTEVHLHCFCVSAIRHHSSLSKYRKQKQSPWKYSKWRTSGGDCFCLRYLLSDESWRIALTQKTMEMDFCIVFCARGQFFQSWLA